MLSKNWTKVVWMVGICLLIFAAAAQAETVKRYAMTGRISAIDLQNDCVVVEVPLGNSISTTVGGSLVPHATLRKNGQTATLKDFNIGEKVKVQWVKQNDGLKIERLTTVK